MSDNNTVCVWAGLYIKEGCEDEFIKAANEVISRTREEKGCLRYELLRDVSEPTKFVFWEEYVDDAAFALHRESSYLRDFREIRARLVDRYLGVRSLKQFAER